MTFGTDKIIKGEVLSFALDNDLTELDQLHAMVDSFGLVHALEKRIIFETNLVLEEIFTNIISYAHEDKNQHQIHFSLLCNKNSVTIRIEDDGLPFNILEAEPVDMETDLEHRSVGGLGIHLIRKLMDDVKYQRVGTKNVVTLRKNCSRKEG
jgi:anti-sigma regulatory factor (Ser/Thr protein kinase)